MNMKQLNHSFCFCLLFSFWIVFPIVTILSAVFAHPEGPVIDVDVNVLTMGHPSVFIFVKMPRHTSPTFDLYKPEK